MDKQKRYTNPLRKRGTHGASATIPRNLLKRLGWNVDDNVIYDVIEGSLVLTKVKLPSVPDLRQRARDGANNTEAS